MKKSPLFVLSILLTTILSYSCNEDNELTDCSDYHWEYKGETAPSNWATCFDDCGSQSQSPVNIKGAVVDASLKALETHYEAVPIELINNGHTVEFEYESGSTLKLNGEDYTLLQFHFHTASEHTLNGNQYPMEVHLVHKNDATGNLAVIGIFFEKGTENTFLANFSGHLPRKADDYYSSPNTVNVKDLFPVARQYYTYSGSLTTPPCSEIVTWLVFKTPVKASNAQIQDMQDIIHDNYRPIQSLNGRIIKEFN